MGFPVLVRWSLYIKSESWTLCVGRCASPMYNFRIMDLSKVIIMNSTERGCWFSFSLHNYLNDGRIFLVLLFIYVLFIVQNWVSYFTTKMVIFGKQYIWDTISAIITCLECFYLRTFLSKYEMRFANANHLWFCNYSMFAYGAFVRVLVCT